MIADSIAIVDCKIGAVRPNVPGLNSGCLLEAGLVGADSPLGSSLVEECPIVGGGDLDLGRGVLLSSCIIELLDEEVVISGFSSSVVVVLRFRPQATRRGWGIRTAGSADAGGVIGWVGETRPSPLSRGP